MSIEVSKTNLPSSAVLTSMDPMSAKASRLFRELSSVTQVRCILLAEPIDTHARYKASRAGHPARQMLRGDFGYLRKVAERMVKLEELHQAGDSSFLISRDVGPVDESDRLTVSELAELTGAEVIQIELRPAGKHRYTVAEGTCAALTRVDFGILLSFNAILSGAVLTASPWGLWSFHPADTRLYRGRPSCFFEYIDSSPYYAVTLQRLVERIDCGPIIAQRFVASDECPNIYLARRALEHSQFGMIEEGVERVRRDGGTQLLPTPDLRLSRLRRESDADRLGPTLRYCMRLIRANGGRE